MEKRRSPRRSQRLGCELWLDGERHGGIVRDVSERGLFVQTRMKAAPDTELILAFAAEGERPELRTIARVARRDILSSSFSSAGLGGLGLEVIDSAEGLGALLSGAGFDERAPKPAAEVQGMRPFRVKLRQREGTRMQTLAVRAPSRQSARARALHRAGKGWKVSEVLEA